MIPIHKSCIPDRNRISDARVGKPATGSPNSSVFTMTNIIIIIAITNSKSPTKDESISGLSENATTVYGIRCQLPKAPFRAAAETGFYIIGHIIYIKAYP